MSDPDLSDELKTLGKGAEGGIGSRLTFMLYRTVAKLVEEAAPYYRSLGLSIPASRTMVAIYEFGELSVGALSQMISIDASTLSHILRRLEKDGLLSRRRLKRDNRIVYVSLTGTGRTLAIKCRQASLEHEAILMDGLSKSDCATLKRILQKIYENEIKGLAGRS